MISAKEGFKMAKESFPDEIKAYLKASQKTPVFFYQIMEKFEGRPYKDLLYAWSALREENALARDREGHYLLKEGF
jgi:hypothetical protein